MARDAHVRGVAWGVLERLRDGGRGRTWLTREAGRVACGAWRHPPIGLPRVACGAEGVREGREASGVVDLMRHGETAESRVSRMPPRSSCCCLDRMGRTLESGNIA